MKISAINPISANTFQGENSKKANSVKTAAGAAMIAIAAAIPAEEAEAQYFVPYRPPIHYFVPVPQTVNVPNCFIYGDATNENYEKTMPEVFSEIDREIEENGQISVNEVVSLEEYNWNSTKLSPMTTSQKINTANLVKNLSRRYNQKGSDPGTINYSEYKSIMDDYMRSKNVSNFLNLLQILTNPYYPFYRGPYHNPHPLPHNPQPHNPQPHRRR